MGMFDDVVVFPPDNDSFRCAAGHLVRGLQTKDLGEPSMTHYFVFERRLHAARGRTDSTPVVVDGQLLLRSDQATEPVPFTGTALLYGRCDECEPVLFLGGHTGFSWDMVQERRPACEWDARFSAAELVAVEPVLLESRAELGLELAKEGLDVLADDDRLARRHHALLREREQTASGPASRRKRRA
jgi:hypothetical protein